LKKSFVFLVVLFSVLGVSVKSCEQACKSWQRALSFYDSNYQKMVRYSAEENKICKDVYIHLANMMRLRHQDVRNGHISEMKINSELFFDPEKNVSLWHSVLVKGTTRMFAGKDFRQEHIFSGYAPLPLECFLNLVSNSNYERGCGPVEDANVPWSVSVVEDYLDLPDCANSELLTYDQKVDDLSFYWLSGCVKK
jgi:hypothetical protein